jgi:transcription-repair coupling factor (superfamily II helicase)
VTDDRIAAAPGGLELAGTPEGFDALVAGDLLRRRGGVGLFVARDFQRANALIEALGFFAPDIEVLRLPAWDCLPYDRVSPSAGVAAERMAALTRLTRGREDRPLMVVATVAAAVQRVPARQSMVQAAWSTRVGRVVDIAELERHFAINGYQRASTVSERGEFAIRGGVIDVFPPGAAEPVRLDMFGDTLESIRAFDPETQRSTRQLTEIDLLPVSEVQLDPASISRFRTRWLEAFGAGADDPVYQAVSEGVRRQGLEHWLPLLHERLDTIFDYLSTGAVVLMDALAGDAIDERLAMIEDAYEARREVGRTGQPYRALAPQALYLTRGEWDERLTALSWRRFSPFSSEGPAVVDLGGVQGRTFAAERAQDSVNLFEAVTAHARSLQGQGRRVLFASWSEGSSERLASMLADHGLNQAPLAADWAEALADRSGRSSAQCCPSSTASSPATWRSSPRRTFWATGWRVRARSGARPISWPKPPVSAPVIWSCISTTASVAMRGSRPWTSRMRRTTVWNCSTPRSRACICRSRTSTC